MPKLPGTQLNFESMLSQEKTSHLYIKGSNILPEVPLWYGKNKEKNGLQISAYEGCMQKDIQCTNTQYVPSTGRICFSKYPCFIAFRTNHTSQKSIHRRQLCSGQLSGLFSPVLGTSSYFTNFVTYQLSDPNIEGHFG